MNDKRSYRDIVLDLEKHLVEYNVHIVYIGNHLKNIDSHLNRLNERTSDCEVSTARAGINVKWIIRIGGGLFTILAGGTALVLKIFGVY